MVEMIDNSRQGKQWLTRSTVDDWVGSGRQSLQLLTGLVVVDKVDRSTITGRQ